MYIYIYMIYIIPYIHIFYIKCHIVRKEVNHYLAVLPVSPTLKAVPASRSPGCEPSTSKISERLVHDSQVFAKCISPPATSQIPISANFIMILRPIFVYFCNISNLRDAWQAMAKQTPLAKTVDLFQHAGEEVGPAQGCWMCSQWVVHKVDVAHQILSLQSNVIICNYWYNKLWYRSHCAPTVVARRSSRSMYVSSKPGTQVDLDMTCPLVKGSWCHNVPQNTCAVLIHFKIFKVANGLSLSLWQGHQIASFYWKSINQLPSWCSANGKNQTRASALHDNSPEFFQNQDLGSK